MNQIQIPNNLRHVRKAANLTQEQVAKALGWINTDRLSRWEHGLTFPHVTNLFKLAGLYKVNAHELYPELSHALGSDASPEILGLREAFW